MTMQSVKNKAKASQQKKAPRLLKILEKKRFKSFFYDSFVIETNKAKRAVMQEY